MTDSIPSRLRPFPPVPRCLHCGGNRKTAKWLTNGEDRRQCATSRGPRILSDRFHPSGIFHRLIGHRASLSPRLGQLFAPVSHRETGCLFLQNPSSSPPRPSSSLDPPLPAPSLSLFLSSVYSRPGAMARSFLTRRGLALSRVELAFPRDSSRPANVSPLDSKERTKKMICLDLIRSPFFRPASSVSRHAVDVITPYPTCPRPPRNISSRLSFCVAT